jgi:murein peptide amidase A
MRRSSHDYQYLIQRWRVLARSSGLRLIEIATVDGFPVYCLKSPALGGCSGLYLSAGIHGDESATTEGLLTWAQRSRDQIRNLPVLIFPCLNPWGLVMNRRSDAAGNDINRMFHGEQHPTVAAVQRTATPHAFDSAMLLHEDYDAQGVYLYELSKRPSFGNSILNAAEAVIPKDPRPRVDGRRARDGIVRPRVSLRRFEEMGHPEAVWLHLRGCVRSITFETPSEASLELRMEAHAVAVARMVELSALQTS